MTQANVLPSDRDFLDELRRVNSERYDAWVITEVPIMLCEHCGRTADDAAGAGSTHCNAPFVVQPHDFSKPHPYLTREVRTDAGIMFDALELGGEVGELLNVVKKLEREDRGWRGSRAAENDFADECGDVLICLDKLARRRGVNLIDATIAKFNATSEKVGLPHRLARHRDASVRELVEALFGSPVNEDTRDELSSTLGRFGWLEAMASSLRDLCAESGNFRATWLGEDPEASFECEQEVDALIKAVRPLLLAALASAGAQP